MKSICVYCGSSHGVSPIYADLARKLGQTLVRRRLDLVYGGGRIGLMGVLADAVLAEGGSVIGVIPESLAACALAHQGLTQLHVVRTMHERKALMERLADGFIALPGGYGTLDELCEILSWSQLGLHGKPVGLLNVRGFFDRFLGVLDHATTEGFLLPVHRGMAMADSDADRLLDQLDAYRPPRVDKWLTPEDA
jgi:uncharacterized protein (TIGR00730 family)